MTSFLVPSEEAFIFFAAPFMFQNFIHKWDRRCQRESLSDIEHQRIELMFGWVGLDLIISVVFFFLSVLKEVCWLQDVFCFLPLKQSVSSVILEKYNKCFSKCFELPR